MSLPFDSQHRFAEYRIMAVGAFFQRLKQGLTKSRETWVQKIGAILQNRQWDEQSLDEMEESLITADVGVKATERLMRALRRQAPGNSEDLSQDMSAKLQAAMVDMLRGSVAAPKRARLSARPWVVIFLGVNGVGKTTLLRALLGLLAPQAGQLQFHPELGRRERMGFVPQRCDFNPTLPITVREFALLGLVGVRANRTQQDERLAWALDKMNLSGMAKKDYWSLSGGQRQRVLVARALVRRPTLLILDEPTNNLDLTTEDAFLQTLSALHAEEQNTVLFVTHNVSIAARYATHIGLVAGGTLVPGRREQVLTAHNLEQLYGQVSEQISGLTSLALPDDLHGAAAAQSTGGSPT